MKQLINQVPSESIHAVWFLPEITAGDHEVGLCGPEDVVDGPGCQHLPHGFVDDLLALAAAHRHRAQEAYGEHLLQEGVCRKRADVTHAPTSAR